MTVHDPARAPRQRGQGYKGDAWTTTVPPDGDQPILLLDTGLDSVGIVRVPDGAWDRGNAATQLHAHDGYDETILVTRGSGTLHHGPSPDRITSTRFEAPVVLQLPPGCWHQVTMDEGVRAVGTGFFTVAGTVIEEFSIQMTIIARGRVTFAELPVADPLPVQAAPWAGGTGGMGTGQAGLRRAGTIAATTMPAAARIREYPEPDAEGLTLPLDTGTDSLFIMAARPGPAKAPTDGPPALLDLPELVDVHRHPDVDEFILRRHGAGYILNGRTPETITLTPFRGPCVLVMPAGAFHRIVQTEEDEVGESILIYSDRRAVVERYETIIARTSVAAPAAAAGEGARA